MSGAWGAEFLMVPCRKLPRTSIRPGQVFPWWCSIRCPGREMKLLRRTFKYPVRRLRLKRSEEHTSELQSHLNLVCRLLLEKKKKKTRTRQVVTCVDV